MSTLPVKDIKLLIKLQEKDRILDDMRSRACAIPARIQELRDSFEEKKNLASAEKEAATRLQVRKKELELELKEKEDGIRKHETEINQIKSNDAYKALLLEIGKAKKEKDSIETEILKLLEDVDAAVKNEKKVQQALREAEAENQREMAALEAEKNRLEGEIKSLEGERAAFSSGVDSDAVSRYEHIRAQRKGLAVVPIKPRSGKDGGGASCGGCNIALTPQSQVDVKKKDALVICDNCQRIIYSPAHVAESENAPAQVPSGGEIKP